MKNEENREIKIMDYAPFWKNPKKILYFIYYFSILVSIIFLFFLILGLILLLSQGKIYFIFFYAYIGFFILMNFILLVLFTRIITFLKKQKLKNIVEKNLQEINQIVKLALVKEPLIFHSLMAFLGIALFPLSISILSSFLELNWFQKTLNIVFGYGIFNILSVFCIQWRLDKIRQ